ncbi:hypothetical protein CP10139811_0514 [Chlamydia ibidis]|uniref:Uncharacterized protein n=2 Tax=Chlamydia ibidis TaxID=1405396 RepID=S7KJ37_9CHLA|nr:hypothetical protein [Chlamydia ibidis]EPP34435.1 hypothetical protein CP10139811_0514 [Chlamydia ibidis]EQM62356.1 hypothetical protein H359_0893 [Chlamydia ibidis 10-1398/6]
MFLSCSACCSTSIQEGKKSNVILESISSKVRRVANLIASIVCVVVLAAGISGIVLFSGVGCPLYTCALASAVIALGLLLSLIISRSLQAIGNAYLSAIHGNIQREIASICSENKLLELDQQIAECEAEITETQRQLDMALQEYHQSCDKHAALAKQKKEAREKLQKESQEYFTQRSLLSTVTEKIRLQTQIESEARVTGVSIDVAAWARLQTELVTCRNALEDKAGKYQEAFLEFNSVDTNLSKEENSISFRNVLPAYKLVIDALKKQISIYKAKIQFLELYLLEINTKLKQIAEKEIELKKEIQDLQTQGSSNQATILELTAQLEALLLSKKDLETSHAATILEIEKSRDHIAAKLNADIQKLKEEKQRRVLECRILNLEEEKKALAQTLQERASKIAQLEKELANSKQLSSSDKAELEAIITRSQSDFNKASLKIKDLTKEVQVARNLHYEIDILRQRVKELEEIRLLEEQSYMSAKKKVEENFARRLDLARSAFQAGLDDLGKKAKLVEQTQQSQQAELTTKLTEFLKDVEKQSKTAESRMEKKIDENKQAYENIAAKNQALQKELSDKLVAAESKANDLQQQVDEARRESMLLKNQLATQTDMATRSSADKVSLERQIHSSEQRNASIQKQLDDASQEVTKLKFTLSLYEDVLGSFESKLKKQAGSDLEKLVKDKEKLEAIKRGTSHYSRTDVSGFRSTLAEAELVQANNELASLKDQLKQSQEELGKLQLELQQKIEQLELECQKDTATIHSQAQVIESQSRQLEALSLQIQQTRGSLGAIAAQPSILETPSSRGRLLALSEEEELETSSKDKK